MKGLLLLIAMTASAVYAQTERLDPKAIMLLGQGQNQLRTEVGAGVTMTILYGEHKSAAPFMILIKWEPGNFSPPHTIDKQHRGKVVGGQCWVGTGSKIDKKHMLLLKEGDEFIQPPGQYHYDGAKKKACWLLIWGDGPFGSPSPPDPIK